MFFILSTYLSIYFFFIYFLFYLSLSLFFRAPDNVRLERHPEVSHFVVRRREHLAQCPDAGIRAVIDDVDPGPRTKRHGSPGLLNLMRAREAPSLGTAHGGFPCPSFSFWRPAAASCRETPATGRNGTLPQPWAGPESRPHRTTTMAPGSPAPPAGDDGSPAPGGGCAEACCLRRRGHSAALRDS